MDRALVNDSWSLKFEGAVLKHLGYARSDHRPILMDTETLETHEGSGERVLRFEAKWLKESNFCDVAHGAWDLASSREQLGDLASKLAFVHTQLHHWDRSVLRSTRKKIRSVQRELEQIMRGDVNESSLARQRELAEEIDKLLEQEELHWFQRSRINWLLFGDKNTLFFQKSASQRKQRNRIKKLKDGNGNWHEGTAYLNPLVSDFFLRVFSLQR